ncbi:MAG TPA: adenylate/guanylate cyclase domain-containing protein [Candidatus Eisenbacteria bacterium]|nr:adenylate/guanylate cyclase domain-containing protein [Candidatus Eisenbacteria bacterium]
MARSRRAVPTGTVTFLFSDIEGSTQLVQELESADYRELLERHQRLLRAAFAAHSGIERGTEGDSFFVVFRDASSAVAAAVEAQRSLQSAGWPPGYEVRVRMGLNTGEGIRGGDDYIGVDVNRAARIASAAHGSQVLVSESTRALSDRHLPSGVALRDLGEQRLKGLALRERVYQLDVDGLRSEFPPLHSEPARATHLPRRLTSFVGRRRDLDEVQRLLVGSRLVSLVGSGGAAYQMHRAEPKRFRVALTLDPSGARVSLPFPIRVQAPCEAGEGTHSHDLPLARTAGITLRARSLGKYDGVDAFHDGGAPPAHQL